MLNLLVRTLSQGLQAFMPVGVALIWYDRHGDSVAVSATRRGLILSLPCTVLAAWAFQHSANQALVETLFGAVAAVIAAAFVRDTWRRGSRGPLASRGVGVLLVVVAAALIVVRPTKEVASVLWTALMELGSVLHHGGHTGRAATGQAAVSPGGCGLDAVRPLIDYGLPPAYSRWASSRRCSCLASMKVRRLACCAGAKPCTPQRRCMARTGDTASI